MIYRFLELANVPRAAVLGEGVSQGVQHGGLLPEAHHAQLAGLQQRQSLAHQRQGLERKLHTHVENCLTTGVGYICNSVAQNYNRVFIIIINKNK